MSTRYRLVFRGKYLPGIDPVEVAANLASLFRVSVSRVDELLARQPAIIKHDVGLDEGNRYLESLAEAGLITHLESLHEANDLLSNNWNGVERRLGSRRQPGRDRREQRRVGAIQPDRRTGDDRRKSD
jgi:hypothetical protein